MKRQRMLLGVGHDRLLQSSLSIATLLALAACGGGGGGNSPAPAAPATPAETLFVPSNAWIGAVPPSAESISADDFRALQAAGQVQITHSALIQAKEAERRTRIESDRAFLESKTDLSPDVTELLAQSRAASDLAGTPSATLPNGEKVSLVDLGSRIATAAETYRLARDPATSIRRYEFSYGLLPDAMKSEVAAPETLRSATLEQVNEATQKLNATLRTSADLDKVRLAPASTPTPQGSGGYANKPVPGNGTDTPGACAPTGLVSRYWFPLRNFVSPIKQQGERGTCWAFTAIAAVESRERVQNNNPVDLSEQFLVSKTKYDWGRADFVDGGSSSDSLDLAVDRNVVLVPEAAWTYNAAFGRPTNAFDADVVGTAASYVGACANYSGTCSETAHQNRLVCTKANGADYCGYESADLVASGSVPSSRSILLWSNGEDFHLDQYRALLASGVSIMASFPVYQGFLSAPQGVVSNYAKQIMNASGALVDGSASDHFVQIVGFLSNEQLSYPGSPSNVGGGGYFIARNSWGCTGDGGYWYFPADYVSSLFSTLEVLEFDQRRSVAWNLDQQTPGGAAGLTIDSRGTSRGDLRVQQDIANTFTVTHPVANYVRLRVTSNVDGPLYDGQWLVNPPSTGSLFSNTLPVRFETQGERTLTITALYGTQVITAQKKINVINDAPTVRFESIGIPQQNESFVVNAIVTDRNEANSLALCNAMTWTVTAPDTITSGAGCERVIRFGTTGAREVRVATFDKEGEPGSASRTFTVAEAPANPYPRVATFGVYSSDSLFAGGSFLGCATNRVSNGSLIDLREVGCSIGLAKPQRYSASITVDNPSAEALTYDWIYTTQFELPGATPLVVTTRTNEPTFAVRSIVFGFKDSSYPCTLDVRVNAPEASRNKTIRVFSGRCVMTERGVS